MYFLNRLIQDLASVERIGSLEAINPKLFKILLRWVDQQGEILDFLAMKIALRALAQIDVSPYDVIQLAALRGCLGATWYNHLVLNHLPTIETGILAKK